MCRTRRGGVFPSPLLYGGDLPQKPLSRSCLPISLARFGHMPSPTAGKGSGICDWLITPWWWGVVSIHWSINLCGGGWRPGQNWGAPSALLGFCLLAQNHGEWLPPPPASAVSYSCQPEGPPGKTQHLCLRALLPTSAPTTHYFLPAVNYSYVVRNQCSHLCFPV